MAPLKAYVIDNEPSQLETIAPKLLTLLVDLGYECVVEQLPIDIVNDAQAKEKIEKALAERPDLVLFDNHFGDDALASFGFQFIASVKPRHPDTIFVLMTRQSLANSEFAKATPYPDLIISKLRFISPDRVVSTSPRQTYDDFFRSEFVRLYHRANVGRIDVPDDLRRAFSGLRSKGRKKSPLGDSELRSLVEQICYMGREGRENRVERVNLQKLEGGLSGSVVCNISLAEGDKPYRVPGVIKFSTRDNALKEIHNHRRYVKWMLPYTWRVDVLGSGQTENFGAVCYAVAHGGSEKPISFDTVLREGKVEQARTIIKSVFDPERQTWYEQRRTTTVDIGQYLSSALPYFSGPDDRARKADLLRELITQVCTRNGFTVLKSNTAHIVKIDGTEIAEELKNFEERLFAENWGMKVEECICHGDMNAGNIMVKPDSADFSFIDFRHTGWHHRARDFCSVEASLRTLFPRDVRVRSFKDYLLREVKRGVEEEERLASVLEQKASIAERTVAYHRYESSLRYDTASMDRDLIGLTRAAFLANFAGATYREYCLAQLVHSWWLLSFDDFWAESQVEILTAQIISLLYLLWFRKGMR